MKIALLLLLATVVSGVKYDTNLVNLEYAYGIDVLRFFSLADLTNHYPNFALYLPSTTTTAPTTPTTPTTAAAAGKRKRRQVAAGNLNITTAHHNPNLCVLYAKKNVFYNSHKYDGALCPPTDMMLTFPNKHNGTMNLVLNVMYKPPTASDSCDNRREKCTEANGAKYAQPLEIHSAEQESEVLGMFDMILPLAYYSVKYTSPAYMKCKIHANSGLSNASHEDLVNNTEPICYDSINRELVLEKNLHSHKCLQFYQLVDSMQTTLAVFENTSAKSEDKAWGMSQTHPCGVKLSSRSDASKIIINFIIIFAAMILTIMR